VLPHVASVGRTDAEELRIDSASIATARIYVPCTISRAMVFGRCGVHRLTVDIPTDTAAST
jgi:hypothetical protein